MKKMGDIIRNIIGIFFIIIGIFGFLTTEDKIFGILLTLFGISFLPIIYMKISILNKNKKAEVIMPIVIFILTIIIVPITASDKSDNNEANVIDTKAEEIILLESLEFEESEIEIDVKEIKSVLLKINPADANIEDMEINSTNYEILKVEKDKLISQKDIIYVNIKPITEGTCEVYAKANEIESNRIKVTIVDNERIEREKKEAEEQARKEMEEQVRKEAEEQARKEAEEQAQKQEEERTKKAETQSQTKQSSATTTQKANKNQNTKQTTSNQTKGATIYITPTGKRYHYSSACGGKNSTATSLENAKARGLTPCKKCAQ